MTQNEALQFLDSLIDYEKITTYSYDAMKLERMRILLEALGNPQDSFKSIHVAGSRGKGSTSAMIYSILREARFSVGLYTSPHLISRNERIRIGKFEDRMITDEELAELIGKVKPVVERLSAEGAGFTFFEVFTALSFLFFKEKEAEFAVVEVGMGGRLDATNVVQPFVAVLLPISYDHTDKLGKTLTKIACEKAHIFKRGAPAIVSTQEAEPLAEIRRVAKEKGVVPAFVPSSYRYHSVAKGTEGSRFEVRGRRNHYTDLFLPLLGEHQIQNAVTAIAVCEALMEKGVVISEEAFRSGLSKVEWPGRFQILDDHPTLIVDGAQNGASALTLKNTLLDLYPKRPLCLILGISANKEIGAVCKTLCPLAAQVIVTAARNIRSLPVDELREYASPYSKRLLAITSLSEAVAWAEAHVGPEGVIVVAGSLYLVGEALALFQKTENGRIAFSHPQT